MIAGGSYRDRLSILGSRFLQDVAHLLNDPRRRQIDPSAASNAFDEVKPWLDDDAPVTAYVPANSRGSDGGYVGQTGVFEVLHVTPAVRQLILDRAPAHAIADAATAEGMFDFHRAGLLQVAKGVTSLEELRRHVPVRLPVGGAVSG